jgi:hypothetical protein
MVVDMAQEMKQVVAMRRAKAQRSQAEVPFRH